MNRQFEEQTANKFPHSIFLYTGIDRNDFHFMHVNKVGGAGDSV